MKKYYYARLDSTMRWKKEFGHGFCNSKEAVAFRAKKDRDEYLADTYDLSAKKLTRAEALRYATPIYGDRKRYGIGIEIYGSDYEFLKMKD
jgi:hypothetical protein